MTPIYPLGVAHASLTSCQHGLRLLNECRSQARIHRGDFVSFSIRVWPANKFPLFVRAGIFAWKAVVSSHHCPFGFAQICFVLASAVFCGVFLNPQVWSDPNREATFFHKLLHKNVCLVGQVTFGRRNSSVWDRKTKVGIEAVFLEEMQKVYGKSFLHESCAKTSPETSKKSFRKIIFFHKYDKQDLARLWR